MLSANASFGAKALGEAWTLAPPSKRLSAPLRATFESSDRAICIAARTDSLCVPSHQVHSLVSEITPALSQSHPSPSFRSRPC
jgi:hypothetical protein